MTEEEWLACDRDDTMLHWLGKRAFGNRGRDRKLRLFACACVRRFWPDLQSESVKRAVEMSEAWADCQVPMRELQAVQRSLRGVWPGSGDHTPEVTPDVAAVMAAGTRSGLKCASFCTGFFNPREQAQAVLLRDIFGNPFRIVTVAPAWLTWNDGTAPKLAQAIYDERAFDRMPVLADALEEAGCADADILDHCRQQEVHVRGCWVLDALLGKT
jgi:hypothetical protein